MNIKELNKSHDIINDDKLNKIFIQFDKLLNELKKKELSQDIYELINESIDILNSSRLNGAQLKKLIIQNQTAILKKIENELVTLP